MHDSALAWLTEWDPASVAVLRSLFKASLRLSVCLRAGGVDDGGPGDRHCLS